MKPLQFIQRQVSTRAPLVAGHGALQQLDPLRNLLLLPLELSNRRRPLRVGVCQLFPERRLHGLVPRLPRRLQLHRRVVRLGRAAVVPVVEQVVPLGVEPLERLLQRRRRVQHPGPLLDETLPEKLHHGTLHVEVDVETEATVQHGLALRVNLLQSHALPVRSQDGVGKDHLLALLIFHRFHQVHQHARLAVRALRLELLGHHSRVPRLRSHERGDGLGHLAAEDGDERDDLLGPTSRHEGPQEGDDGDDRERHVDEHILELDRDVHLGEDHLEVSHGNVMEGLEDEGSGSARASLAVLRGFGHAIHYHHLLEGWLLELHRLEEVLENRQGVGQQTAQSSTLDDRDVVPLLLHQPFAGSVFLDRRGAFLSGAAEGCEHRLGPTHDRQQGLHDAHLQKHLDLLHDEQALRLCHAVAALEQQGGVGELGQALAQSRVLLEKGAEELFVELIPGDVARQREHEILRFRQVPFLLRQ
mmetsp:Transcript_4314/g.19626  ORF Transcript_4314/g.19626 Transcript_4314/m.19626 type:complete len:473 (+) Transcript_4314:527-1945(+)